MPWAASRDAARTERVNSMAFEGAATYQPHNNITGAKKGTTAKKASRTDDDHDGSSFGQYS